MAPRPRVGRVRLQLRRPQRARGREDQAGRAPLRRPPGIPHQRQDILHLRRIPHQQALRADGGALHREPEGEAGPEVSEKKILLVI